MSIKRGSSEFHREDNLFVNGKMPVFYLEVLHCIMVDLVMVDLFHHVKNLVLFLFQKEDDIPLVEWWDADLLPNRTYADYERDVPPESKYREISNLVEHPVPVLPIGRLYLYLYM